MARVLVVDDSKKVRKLVETYLIDDDHDVLSAADAFSGLELLDKHLFDLAILDVNMPYKNGFAALEAIRRNKKLRMLPVIFMTARNSKRDVEKAISLGAEAYMLKPIASEDLLGKVSEVLSRRETSVASRILPKAEELGVAKIIFQSEARILRITELSVDIESTQIVEEGRELKVNSPIFSHIGIDPKAMRVVSVRGGSGNFLIKLSYVGLCSESVQKLRHWLQSEESQKAS